MKRIWLSRLATTFLALHALVASAQQIASGRISHVEGTVFLDGQRLESSATHVPIKENSLVRTEAGRIKILLAPGVDLRLAENGSFRIVTNRPNDTRIELLSGSAIVLTDDNAVYTNPFNRLLAGKVTVICENAVTLSNFGAYRFDSQLMVLPTQREHRYCRFRVYKGNATVQLSSLSAVVMSGETMNMNRECGDHIPVSQFDIGDTDEFDRWSRQSARSDAPHP